MESSRNEEAMFQAALETCVVNRVDALHEAPFHMSLAIFIKKFLRQFFL